jgi:hypothetical protein
MVDLDQCCREHAVTGCAMILVQTIGSGLKGLTMTEVAQRWVAIVDDDLAVRDSLRFLLEIIGHPVETYASAAEFLNADKQHLVCLILDHHMPEAMPE